MKFTGPFVALCAALCLALPIAGCTTYSSVSRRRAHFESETPEGRALARALAGGVTRHRETMIGACLDCAAAAEKSAGRSEGAR
jgi:hypothetical protein